MQKLRNTILILLLAVFQLQCQNIENSSASYLKNLKNVKIQSDPSMLWKNFDPGMSGYNEEFWCHPTDKNVIFMGSDMHVAYGSWDNGKSRQTIKDSDGFGKDLERVHDITFSTQNPDFGLALERRENLFETKDRERTWKLIYTIPGAKNSSYNAHTKLAIHPTDDSIWFTGAGNFWNVKANHRSKSNLHGKLHKRAKYGYVLKTINHGKNWKKVATGISENLDVARIICNPANPKHVFIATNYGVFISNDTGDNWKASGKGLPRDLTSYYNPKTKEFFLYLVEQSIYEPKGKILQVWNDSIPNPKMYAMHGRAL